MVVAGRIDFEELAVDLADLAPLVDVRDVDPRADDVGGLAAQGLDGGDDDLQGTAGLSLESRPESAVRLDPDGPGHEDEVPGADGASSRPAAPRSSPSRLASAHAARSPSISGWESSWYAPFEIEGIPDTQLL